MRKIAVINYKGGMGKTTVACNLAAGIGLSNYNVLLVDTDPQGAVAHYFGCQPDKGLYEFLRGTDSFSQVRVALNRGMDLICSNERLFPYLIYLANKKNKEQVLKEAMDNADLSYDYVLVDCSSDMNLMNQNVLVYCDEIIIPVSFKDPFSLYGLKQLLKNIQIINRIFSKSIKISMVVPTFFDESSKVVVDMVSVLNNVFPGLLSEPLFLDDHLGDAGCCNKSIFEYRPESIGAIGYNKLVKEVLSYV